MPVDFEKLKQDIIAGITNFRCLYCGYNLRGLQGEPKRCPECGQVNSIEKAIITDQDIQSKLKELESLPTICTLGSLLFLIVLGNRVMGYLFVEWGFPFMGSGYLLLILALATIVPCFFLMKRVRRVQGNTWQVGINLLIILAGVCFTILMSFLVVVFVECTPQIQQSPWLRHVIIVGYIALSALVMLMTNWMFRRRHHNLLHDYAIQLIHEQWKDDIARRSL